MVAEKVVAAARPALGRTGHWRIPCAFSPGLFLGALGIAALALSCRGPLSDACDEVGKCAPSTSGDASLEGSSDASSCDPTRDPKDEPCVLDSAYGVFVASAAGADAGAASLGTDAAAPDGTAGRPYTSIGQALANLAGKSRIYVCNGTYAEQVSITAAVSVYGGLSCATSSAGRVWKYVGQSAQVMAPPSAYALLVTGVQPGTVVIEDMSFAAPDATAPGTSSVAAFVASSSVRLVRVALSAGNGTNGAPGADGTANPNYRGQAPAGSAQVWTTVSGIFSAISGGAGAVNECLVFGSSAGGDGGLGCASAPGVSGGSGTAGTASPAAPVVTAGRDGLPMGFTTVGDAGAATILTANDPGADGVASDGGAPSPPQVYGALSPAGWVPAPGGDGAPGGPGQGGAGASDPLYGRCSVAQPSLGGGGGGSGGCGGAGGKGGGGGGASIALAAVRSTLNLTTCALSASGGGIGGQGGAGQDGQAGGVGGDVSGASQLHAAGALGGNGAGGSGGAGGTGGVSVAVLASGSTITVDESTSQNTRLGGPGAGGAGGPAGRHASAGALTTGVDGNSGAPGSAGTASALLKLM